MARNGLRDTATKPGLYLANMLFANAVFGSNQTMNPRIFADRHNLLCSQFRRMMLLAAANASLVARVVRILFLRSSAKMPRIDAGRIIAIMKNHASVWNWLPEHLISMAVSKYRLVVDPQQPIAKRSFGAFPYPASIGFIDSCHERLGRAYFWKLIQLSSVPSAVVAVFAQLSTVGRFPTLQARRLDSMITHIAPFIHYHNRKQGVMQ